MKTNYRFGEVTSLFNQIEYSSERVQFQQVFETANGGVALVAMKAGQKLDTHTAPFEVMVNLCEGEIEFTMIDKVHKMKAGDFLLMGADIAHSVEAKADSKLLLVKVKN